MSLLLSVIVPTRNDGDTLAACLEALERSDLRRAEWELIVVDDASEDASAAIAARHADLVVRLPGRARGPAYSRNRGVEVAHAETVVFVDPRLVVHPAALRLYAESLDADLELSAVTGAFDDWSEVPGITSGYWNLAQAYHDARSTGETASVNPGFVAIRKDALIEAGRFDEWRLAHRETDDHSLGARLRAQNMHIARNSDVRATSWRRWAPPSMLADVWSRGMMQSRLAQPDGVRASGINADAVSKIAGSAGVVTCLAVLGAMVAPRAGFPATTAALTIVAVATILANVPLLAFLTARRGIVFAVATLPLHMLAGVTALGALLCGWAMRHLFGDPNPDATTQAFAELDVQTWPPVPRKK